MTREDLEGLRVYVDDVHPGYCAWGMRAWATAHGFNLRDFIENGIDAVAIFDTGDEMALAVLERKLHGKQ